MAITESENVTNFGTSAHLLGKRARLPTYGASCHTVGVRQAFGVPHYRQFVGFREKVSKNRTKFPADSQKDFHSFLEIGVSSLLLQ